MRPTGATAAGPALAGDTKQKGMAAIAVAGRNTNGGLTVPGIEILVAGGCLTPWVST